MDIAQWMAEIRELIGELESLPLPYPLSGNRVHELTGRERLLPPLLGAEQVSDALRRFYEECDGVSLNNVWNGYWIFPATDVAARFVGGEVTKIEGCFSAEVIVFGGNGGGGRFAIRTDGSDDVLYLPSCGAVSGTVWLSTPSCLPEVISESFEGFLCRVRDDFKAFISGDSNWQYIASR